MLPIVPRSICRNLDQSLHYEWLETNGLGGYASSTIHNCNTRKYHGLLVASLAEPAGRFTLLSKLEDSLTSNSQNFALSCNRYPGTLHPEGYLYLEEFRENDGPLFTYKLGSTIILRKRILMIQGENTVLIRYELEQAPSSITLNLNPLLAFRRHHELKREDAYLCAETTPVSLGFSIHPYDGLPSLFIQASLAPRFRAAPDWYRNIEYMVESERGYDYHEDCFCPGTLEFTLQPGESVIISASLGEQADLPAAWEKELSRRRSIDQAVNAFTRNAGDERFTSVLPALIKSGYHFPIRTPGSGRATIIAGYPWFDDWGRDTLISLPGLTFYSGRPDLGAEILKAVAPHEREGLIPNCFAANPAQHAYNSVDASLLYFWAIHQFLDSTGDLDTVRIHLWPTLKRITKKFMDGTRFDTYMTPSGLLHAGDRHTQLTWMDATVFGEPVTPRHGLAVDLNAFWYNAIVFSQHLAGAFGEPTPWPDDLPARIQAAFLKTFWLEAEGYLADSYADGVLDRSIRPNQIFAVSLPFSPLNLQQQKRVVEVVRQELLTPFGLRTLSPRDPHYRGRYEGDQPARDSAYHQGTVWPWLLGHFGEAVLRTSDNPEASALSLADMIRPLLDYSLTGPGLINVPEVFDGTPPHRPNGCPAQAWSSAELIRLFMLFARINSR